MALVGEPRLERSLRKRHAVEYQTTGDVQLAHGAVAAGARAKGGPELARKGPAIQLRDLFEHIQTMAFRGIGSDHGASAVQAFHGQADRSGGTAASGRQSLEGKIYNIDSAEFVDLVVKVPQPPEAGQAPRGKGQDGFGNEWQGFAPQGLLHQHRIEIEHPVPEAGLSPGGTVMHLVRMQDVTPPRQGISTLAAIAERLYASERKTDRISVVPVQTERLPLQDQFQPFYAFASAAGNQSINRVMQVDQVAQSFKIIGRTFGHGGAHRSASLSTSGGHMMRSARRAMIGVACLAALGMSGARAGAQTIAVKEKPPLYRYVSYWAFPRADGADLDKDGATGNQRILAAALADGTLVGYGDDENQVHSAEGFTHARWVQAKSIASLMKMVETVHKDGGSSSPLLAGSTRHWDQIYISSFYNWKAGSWKGAYGYSGTARLKPDAPDAGDAVRTLSSFYVPLFEKMLADGIIVEYEIDRMIHTTDAPAQIRFSFVIPNADGLDRFQAAIGAAIDENSLIGPAFGSMTVNEQFDFAKVNATYN
jgi:hypothetical protein